MLDLVTTIDVDAGGMTDPAAPPPRAPRGTPSSPNEVRGKKALSRKLRNAAIQQLATGRPEVLASGMWSGGNSYNGAAQTRLNRDWPTSHMSGDLAIYGSWDALIRRARDLIRNEPWARAAVQRVENNVVGEGIQSQAEVEFDDGTLDDETNAEIDAAFRRWAEHDADSAGELSWHEIQQLAARETVSAGEAFLVECYKPGRDRIAPVCYQSLEAEQLFPGYDWPGAWTAPDGEKVAEGHNKIKRGIEFDRWGSPVSYRWWSAHPYDVVPSLQMRAVIVPAARVVHYYEKERPSLTRGVTWFAAILQAMRDLGEYLGDEMTAARVGCLFAVAIKRAAGAGTGLGLEDDSTATDLEQDTNNPLVNLGSGIIGDIGPEDSIEQIDPNRPNKNAEPFIRLILTSMANGIGLSYMGLTNDVASANFSSARFARQADKVFWRVLQGRFGRRVVLNVRRRVVRQLIALGRIKSVTPQMFDANPERYLATKLLPPGWEEIDPSKDLDAAIGRIRAGLSTLQEECAGRGKSWRRNLVQRKREQEFAGELGLALSIDQLPAIKTNIDPLAAPAAQPADVAGDEKTTDEEGA